SWPRPDDHHGLSGALRALGAEARRLVGGDAEDSGVVVETAVDCRYRGQSHEITVPAVDGFHAEHRRRNGYERSDAVVEVVALRATATRAPDVAIGDLPAPERLPAPVRGPAVVAEADC